MQIGSTRAFSAIPHVTTFRRAASAVNRSPQITVLTTRRSTTRDSPHPVCPHPILEPVAYAAVRELCSELLPRLTTAFDELFLTLYPRGFQGASEQLLLTEPPPGGRGISISVERGSSRRRYRSTNPWSRTTRTKALRCPSRLRDVGLDVRPYPAVTRVQRQQSRSIALVHRPEPRTRNGLTHVEAGATMQLAARFADVRPRYVLIALTRSLAEHQP